MKDNNNSEVVILERFEANSFMGIDKSKPVIIDWSERRKNQNVAEFTGDEAKCKSSTICAIIYAMGGTLGLDKKRLMNGTDKDIDVTQEFTWKDENYKVVIGPSRVVVKKYYPERDKWKDEDEPMTLLRTIFGPVGLSPFSLREQKGKAQIKYFRDMFGGGEEASKKELKLDADISKVFDARRDVNKEIKNITGALEVEPMWQAREKTQAKFKVAPSATKEKQKMEELQGRKSEYDKAKAGMEGLERQKSGHVSTIADLERRLKEENEKLAAVNKRIEDSNAYLKQNKGIEDEYADANEAWLNISKTLTEYEKWKSLLKKEKELNELQEASNKATGQLDRLRVQQAELVQTYIPKVKGLEVKVQAGLDDEIEQEGVYYNKRNIGQLSESEYVSLWSHIWDKMGMNFIFLENSSSLGSNTVEILNQLAKNGAMIMATKMVRKQKDLEVHFVTKIE